MNELRMAAENFEEVKGFPKLADENNSREYKEVAEHKEDHSYLPDYFIGTSQWFGWKINKRKYFDLNNEQNREELFIAAAEGRYKVPAKEEEKQARQQSEGGELRIEDYSPKAIVIRGNTKERREDLRSLGAKFNPRLKGGPGWIFPKRLQAVAEDALNL